MAYIIAEPCIDVMDKSCVEVCPVDCIYEPDATILPEDEQLNMLYIHPEECIDCGVCEPECPIDAILPDTEGDLSKWVEHNRIYSELWPNITRMIAAPPDARDSF